MRVIHVDSRSPECVGTSTSFMLNLATTLDSERLRRIRVDGFRVSSLPAYVDTVYVCTGLVASVDLQGPFGIHDALLAVPMIAGQGAFSSGVEVWIDIPLSLTQTIDFKLRDQHGGIIAPGGVGFVTFSLTMS